MEQTIAIIVVLIILVILILYFNGVFNTNTTNTNTTNTNTTNTNTTNTTNSNTTNTNTTNSNTTNSNTNTTNSNSNTTNSNTNATNTNATNTKETSTELTYGFHLRYTTLTFVKNSPMLYATLMLITMKEINSQINLLLTFQYSNNNVATATFDNWTKGFNISGSAYLNGNGPISNFYQINYAKNTILLNTPLQNDPTSTYPISYIIQQSLSLLGSKYTYQPNNPALNPIIKLYFKLTPLENNLSGINLAKSIRIKFNKFKIYNHWEIIITYSNNRTVSTITPTLQYPISNITSKNFDFPPYIANYINLPINSKFCSLDLQKNIILIDTPIKNGKVMSIKYNLNKPVIQTILAALPKNSHNPF